MDDQLRGFMDKGMISSIYIACGIGILLCAARWYNNRGPNVCVASRCPAKR